jgi:hypothetical protein
MSALNINWEGSSTTLDKGGYVGTISTKLFNYSWSSGTLPWKLTTTLPGYTNRQWTFHSEAETVQFAQRLLVQFIGELSTARESVSGAT